MQPLAVGALASGVVMIVGVTVTLILIRVTSSLFRPASTAGNSTGASPSQQRGWR